MWGLWVWFEGLEMLTCSIVHIRSWLCSLVFSVVELIWLSSRVAGCVYF